MKPNLSFPLPSARRSAGFTLVEALMAILMLAMAAMLLTRISATNAAMHARSGAQSAGIRLGSELAEWVRRGGYQALGTPLPQAMRLADSRSGTDCYAGGCNAEQAAWHYLAHWQERVRRGLPDAKWLICADQALPDASAGWTCASDGATWVLKIGRSADTQPLVIELGPIA